MDLFAKTVNAECDITDIRYIEISDFYRDRVMKNEIDGRFPKNESEVILGKEASQNLFNDENPLGKVIMISNGRSEVSVTVVGINNTKNAEGIYLSYVPNKITFDIAGGSVEEFANVDLKTDIDNSSNVYTGGYTGSYGTTNTYSLIEGNYPQNEKEIAIDIMIYDEYMEQHSKDNLFNEELYLYLGNVFDVRISGVYDSDAKQMFCVSDEVVKAMKSPLPTSVYCYAKNDSIINDFKDTSIDKKFTCALMFEHLRGKISEKTGSVGELLLILAIVLCGVSFVVIGSFVKMTIKERIYEIGVIRALGGSKKNIKGIFWLESILIGCFSAFIALILFLVGKIILANTVMEDMTYDGMLYIVLSIIFSGILLVIISSAIPLRRINSMKPIECIRQR